jgi:ribokinase
MCVNVLTIGGATQDIFLHYPGAGCLTLTKKNLTLNYMLFESGEKVEIDKIFYRTGGGATNSAASFKKLGLDVSCLSIVGNDHSGQAIIKDLEATGINTSLIQTTTQEQSAVSYIINTFKSDRTVFVYRGANQLLDLSALTPELLKNYKQLYITSLTQQASEQLPRILSQAKKLGLSIAINPGSSQLIRGTSLLKSCLSSIDTLIMNSSEAKTFMFALVGLDTQFKKALEECQLQGPCNIDNEQPYLLESPIPYEDIYFSITKFFSAVLKMGPKVVVITNGSNGVYAATKDGGFFHPSIKTDAISPVGAGDSFGSCFIAHLMMGASIDNALRSGIVNSASVINHIGAKEGLLDRNSLAEKVKALPSHLLQKFSI